MKFKKGRFVYKGDFKNGLKHGYGFLVDKKEKS